MAERVPGVARQSQWNASTTTGGSPICLAGSSYQGSSLGTPTVTTEAYGCAWRFAAATISFWHRNRTTFGRSGEPAYEWPLNSIPAPCSVKITGRLVYRTLARSPHDDT